MNQIKATAKFKIKKGKLDAFKSIIPEIVRAVRQHDTGTLTYEWYLNEDLMECAVVEVYQNSDAVLEHAGNIGEFLSQLIEVSDFSLEVYGNPSAELREAIAGFDIKIYPYRHGA